MNGPALVIGASGFIGGALLRGLRALGVEARGTGRRAGDGCDALDVTDARAVSAAMEGCATVFNLAGHRGREVAELDEACRVNTLGTANVLAAAARARTPPAVVLVGSGEEYGASTELPYREDGPLRPISAYGASKLAATELARAAAREVPVVVVRPSVVYGPGQPAYQLVASAVRAAVRGEACTLRGGAQTRDMVYVDDVVEALVAAAARARGAARGAVVNVGSGREHSVREIAERVVALAGGGTLVFGEAPTRPGDTARSVFHIGRARELLDWAPRTALDDGLARTIAAERRAR